MMKRQLLDSSPLRLNLSLKIAQTPLQYKVELDMLRR